MSKHNYSQYSNNKKYDTDKVNVATEITETPVVVDEAPVKVKMETVAVPEPKIVTGVVVNCAKLNVREEANADAAIVAVLPMNTEIEIDIFKSNSDWVAVCTETGITGYCMRKFVNAKR
jgi:hypothetical protein